MKESTSLIDRVLQEKDLLTPLDENWEAAS